MTTEQRQSRVAGPIAVATAGLVFAGAVAALAAVVLALLARSRDRR